MDELIIIMSEIRDQLAELNSKIDNLTGYDTKGISDIISAIEQVKGYKEDDLSDVCNKLDEINLSLCTIDTSISFID